MECCGRPKASPAAATPTVPDAQSCQSTTVSIESARGWSIAMRVTHGSCLAGDDARRTEILALWKKSHELGGDRLPKGLSPSPAVAPGGRSSVQLAYCIGAGWRGYQTLRAHAEALRKGGVGGYGTQRKERSLGRAASQSRSQHANDSRGWAKEA